MAEAWEVILWTVVAVVFVIIVVVVIVSICSWRKKSRRRKKVSRRRGLEWGRRDETDFVKKQVPHNAKRGEAKILDEQDSGVQTSQRKEVHYSVKSGEAKILDVVDGDSQREKQTNVKSREEGKVNYHDTASQTSENGTDMQATFTVDETFQSQRTKVSTNGKISQHKNRERLQPLEIIPAQNTSRRLVNSYTNLGYNQGYNEQRNAPPAIQFQQPVAVVKALVHSGSPRRIRKAKSLRRNFSKLNYKKAVVSTRTPRYKPTSYHWSLAAKKSHGPQSWIHVPIRYKEIEQPVTRRRTVRSSESRRITTGNRAEHVPSALEDDYTSRKYTRTIPMRRSRRSLERRSLERRSLTRQREKRLANTRASFNDVYITDSKSSHADGRGAVRANYQKHTSKQPHRIPSPPSSNSTSDPRNVGNYYEESYNMVKRSEYPEKQSSSSQHDADMVSMCGSEFSDCFVGPPRPSDSQSEDHERWERKREKEGHLQSYDNYSRGSYKEYSSRVQDWDKTSSRQELAEETTHEIEDDQSKHLTSFQNTLESLKNGNNKSHYAEKEDDTEAVQSPWLNNDKKFRKAHSVPISGVPVLPPQPVFIQTEDTD